MLGGDNNNNTTATNVGEINVSYNQMTRENDMKNYKKKKVT